MFFAHFVNSAWMFGLVDLLNDCFRTNAKHSFSPVLPLKSTFGFQKEDNLRKCFTNGKEALFFQETNHRCGFALQNILQFCAKNINLSQCYLGKQYFFKVWFWKKGTLATKLFKQAPFFNKQAHFSRKYEFPCKAFLLVKVFSSKKKQQELRFTPRNSWKTWGK